MDHPELSLGPTRSSLANIISESEASNIRKRKVSSLDQDSTAANIDLQLHNPLPLDWEKCLDLQSARMCCIDKKTLKKRLVKQKGKQFDLDLNIANFPAAGEDDPSSVTIDETLKQSGSNNGGGGMVAIVCLNCYLLVMLYRSSPSCPNCKFMHSLLPSPAPHNVKAVKSLETLSLLH